MSSKYGPLGRHLASLRTSTWRARFSEIEEVLGFALPASARRYPAWWGNLQGSKGQAASWLNVGWLTGDVDVNAGRLTFRRILDGDDRPGGGSARPRAQHSAERARHRPIVAADPALPHNWAVPFEPMAAHLNMAWRVVGRALLDEGERLLLPDVPAAPGLYRFVLRQEGRERRYVGESSDLKRRFGFYRNPGRSQQTNIRLNNLLRGVLARGGAVSVDLATQVEMRWEGDPAALDLNDKAVRRMFEHFALVVDAQEGVESLNR